MSDENRFTNDPAGPATGGQLRKRRRVVIIWFAVFFGILLLVVLRDRTEANVENINQNRFLELVNSGQIAHAVINYDPQNSPLNEVAGTYYKVVNSTRVEVPFRARIRLNWNLEERLLALPQFEPHQPNTVLMGIVWSILPFVVIGVLIWFFFIRQIKKAGASQSNLQSKTETQQGRMDRILDKWEEQGKRMDAVLDRLEKR